MHVPFHVYQALFLLFPPEPGNEATNYCMPQPHLSVFCYLSLNSTKYLENCPCQTSNVNLTLPSSTHYHYNDFLISLYFGSSSTWSLTLDQSFFISVNFLSSHFIIIIIINGYYFIESYPGLALIVRPVPRSDHILGER